MFMLMLAITAAGSHLTQVQAQELTKAFCSVCACDYAAVVLDFTIPCD